MKKTLYHDGIEIHGDNLNNIEATKIEALKDRQEFVKAGTIGLLVTAGVGNTVNISEGVGYCANGERLKSVGVTGVDVIPGQYNFITLIYKEVEGTPKPHENTGDSYNTRIEESYEVSVLSELAYNTLSNENKNNRIVCGIVKDGNIQTGHDLSRIPISSAIDISGIWIGQYSEKTLDGIGYFEFDRTGMKIRYKAPSDSWGVWKIITPSWADSENIKLESYNTDYWTYVEVLSSLLPVENSDAEVNIRDLYKPPVEGDMELGYNTSTGSSVDRFHRSTHLIYPPSVDENGAIKEKNPHGIHCKDLTGYRADIHRHQDLMHCNGIIAKEWFLTGESDVLKPVCDEATKKLTITNDLGPNDYYHINGVIFDEIDEIFPWEHIFNEEDTYYVVLGADKKFHVFKNSYNTKNYIPIVRVYSSGVPPIPQIEGLSFGGVGTRFVLPTTEEYNNHVWTSSNNLNVGRYQLGGAGIQGAALSFGGWDDAVDSVITEEYNGTIWAGGGDLSIGMSEVGSAGTQSAALSFGGFSQLGAETAACEEYNGTSWAAGGSMSNKRRDFSGCGTQNAGLAIGGYDGAVHYDSTEHYNGTAWSAGGNLSKERRAMASVGTQTSALVFGGTLQLIGITKTSEEYNGASWSAGGDLNAAVEWMAGCGTQGAGLSFGGKIGDILQVTTEEYNGVNWVGGGDLNTARRQMAGAGV